MQISQLKIFIHNLLNRIQYSIRFFGRNIYVHKSSYISPKATLRTVGGGSISIGSNCEIHDYSMILTYGGDIVIGEYCSLNPFTIAYGHGGLTIGNGVRIAAHTTIIPANHIIDSDVEVLHKSGLIKKGIVIDDNVWIASGVRILDGVHIAENVSVGAGSVVTRNIKAGITVCGIPAKELISSH